MKSPRKNVQKQSLENVKDVNSLVVYRGNMRAGVLLRTELGCEFVFDELFLKNTTYKDLTYRMPKTNLPIKYSGINLPPFFAGLLPEGLRFKALVKKVKTSEDDLFSLLAASGENVIGDVYSKTEDALLSVEMPAIKLGDINFYKAFQNALEFPFKDNKDDVIAGVQEKISASMINFPVSIAKDNKQYILKLNPKDKKNLTENEYYCLKLAKKCGLSVNFARLIYDKDKNPGLLVERFDRSQGSLDLIHQEDACQFLNRYPADKYRISFNEICNEIKNLSTAPMIEIMRVLELYIFSYLIGNGDLHAKNISLQTDIKTGKIQLTPAYDIICTYIYKDQSMAIKLDGRDKNFKKKYFIEFGKRFGLSEKALSARIDKLKFLVLKNYEELLRIPGLTDKQKKGLQNLILKRIQDL